MLFFLNPEDADYYYGRGLGSLFCFFFLKKGVVTVFFFRTQNLEDKVRILRNINFNPNEHLNPVVLSLFRVALETA